MATAYTIGSVTVILVAHLLLSCPRCIVIWICTNRSISNANSFNHPRHEHPKRGHRHQSNVDRLSKRYGPCISWVCHNHRRNRYIQRHPRKEQGDIHHHGGSCSSECITSSGWCIQTAVQSRLCNVCCYRCSFITIYMTDFTPREIIRLIALFFAEILNISAADVPIGLLAHFLL